MNTPLDASYIWAALTQISMILVGLFAGGTFTVPSVNWLKEKLGWEDGLVYALVAGFAVVLTVAANIVEGVIAPGTVTPETWGAMVLAIIVQSSQRYHQLKRNAEE